MQPVLQEAKSADTHGSFDTHDATFAATSAVIFYDNLTYTHVDTFDDSQI